MWYPLFSSFQMLRAAGPAATEESEGMTYQRLVLLFYSIYSEAWYYFETIAITMILYYTLLYYIVSYYIIFYYTTLYYIMFTGILILDRKVEVLYIYRKIIFWFLLYCCIIYWLSFCFLLFFSPYPSFSWLPLSSLLYVCVVISIYHSLSLLIHYIIINTTYL